ncbi:hypothetical protein AGOR_G00149980 [Albula goreensis]|uniref:Uncharacterized protein n=1 Tax=Albula goreensis TaxID=1534307 RepID=A0A8T3D329_9TELE|nr:hypothetical protein AGOR_G00149980 [Albula goreensis]
MCFDRKTQPNSNEIIKNRNAGEPGGDWTNRKRHNCNSQREAAVTEGRQGLHRLNAFRIPDENISGVYSSRQ